MNAIVYRNKQTTIPGWVNTLHVSNPIGLAYLHDGYFVHLYGHSHGLWVVSIGLTASEKQTNETLEDWAIRAFGAEDIKPLNNLIGEAIEGVWRPGLYYQNEVLQALKVTEYEQRSAEQALRILIDKLDDLLLYIEPSSGGLMAFGHKTRELLILACTEVETTFKKYMKITGTKPANKNFGTIDYVKLLAPLFLDEYEIKVKPYRVILPIKPFSGWNSGAPTQSLAWYNAYNKTKHDRENHFNEATLEHCISAIAANIVLFCVRFSPFPLFQGANSLSGMVNQLFEININPNPTTFYVPRVEFENKRSQRLVCGAAKEQVVPWVSKPLII